MKDAHPTTQNVTRAPLSVRSLLCIAHLAACTVLLAAPGESSSAITVRDATGVAHTPLAADARKATVLLFFMHDCPVANASSPAIARLAADFTPRGVKFFGVYASETAGEVTKHRESYQLPFPGLLDPQCQLARHVGATRVPEAAVISPLGRLLYRGRIDDRATQPGSIKPQPTREDLRLALEAILAGKPVEPSITEAVGCHLPLQR